MRVLQWPRSELVGLLPELGDEKIAVAQVGRATLLQWPRSERGGGV